MFRHNCLLIAVILFSCNTINAQLFNNGATITIQNGAQITAMGDVINSSGTISNNGKLEVQGNFINNGNYNSIANEDSLIMTGPGIDTLRGGISVFNYIAINKTGNADMVRLGGTTLLNNKFDHLSGLFSTDPISNPSFTLTSPVTAIYNFAPGNEILGSVKRTGWSNAITAVFNQPNMLVTTNTGTAPTEVTVTMLPLSTNGDPTDSEREVKRKFQFAQAGGSGFIADVRLPYSALELNTNNENNLVAWGRFSGEWNAKLNSTRDVAADWVNITGLPQTEFLNEWKLADPKYVFNVTANLRGAWNGTAMNTTLNSAGIIPLAQPYNITPFNYTGTESVASIPNANIVDWVLIEHRKPSTGLPADAGAVTITGRKAGFLLNTGVVTELDGVTPITFDITKQGTAFITVRHRNHLGALSVARASNAAGTFANDYGVLANVYKAPAVSSDPVILLAGATGKYGLWAGDANRSGNLALSDVNGIKLATVAALTGYLNQDVNLSANLAASDINLTKLMISGSATSSTPARQTAKPAITSNIPD